ncbi:GNAT family N-acetyltransferase, partial [Enterococcus faecium]
MGEEIKTDLVLAENQWIETERLILRPVTLADTEDVYEYASDEVTTRFLFPAN